MGADESSPAVTRAAMSSSEVREVIPPQVAPFIDSDTEFMQSETIAALPYLDPDSRERMVMWHRACEYHEHEIGEGKEPRIDDIAEQFIEVPEPRDLPPAPFEEPLTRSQRNPNGATGKPQKKKKKEKEWNGVELPLWKVIVARSARGPDSDSADEIWTPDEEEQEEEEESLSDGVNDYEQLMKLTPNEEMKMIRKRVRGKSQPRPCLQEELMFEWHPAACAEYAALRKIPRNATNSQMRYHCEKYLPRKEAPRPKIPRFWERKPWDTDDDFMSEDDSAVLQAKIQGLMERDTMLVERACRRMEEPGKSNMIYFGRFNAARRLSLIQDDVDEIIHFCSEESEENEEREPTGSKALRAAPPLRMKTRRTTHKRYR